MATEAPLLMSQSLHPRRPNSLLIPPNPAYVLASPRGGILLNALRPATSGTLSPFTPSSGLCSSGVSTPRSPSPLSAPLAPEPTRSERTQSDYLSLGSRKIRFAPLPDPRREVMVAQDGAEIPCSTTYAPDATAYPLQSPGAGPSVAFDRTDSIVTDSGASTNSTEADTQSQTARKRAKRNSILKLFGMKSSSSLSKRTSTASLPTADLNGTFGIPGLGLFRPNSRESWSGELSGYTSDNSLARRVSSPLRPSSAGGRSSAQPNYGSFGAPLMHATSDSGVQRPQRMLNGRVYGARRAKERIQPLPSMEPEFSEWGYGGMGSVSTSGEYSKLQSKTSSVGGRGGNDDDDDGSGLTWIRKRREKKELEEREKKAAEEAAAAAATAAEVATTEEPSRQRASTETADSTPTIHAEPAEITSTPQTPTGSSRVNPPMSPTRSQVTRTISSPPSRQNSTATVTPDRHHPTVVAVPAHRGRQEAPASSSVVTSPETSPERSSGSSRRSNSSDDEDAEASSSTTGRDDDEEEEEENQKRKTALSAGIEKISRHHA